MSIHSFLLIGQSNMAGRGVIGSVPPIENPRLLVARNGRWQPLFVPVNPDRPFSGICLGESFADSYSRDFSQDTGLIPCADGGTSLDQWKPGSLLYDHAVAMAKLAQRTSTLAGILWHQGETDCTPQDSPLYGEKLLEMLRCLRRDLDAPQVPILLGGLGDFPGSGRLCPGHQPGPGTGSGYPASDSLCQRQGPHQQTRLPPL